MSAPTFVEWPKIPRLNRQMVITEKIDGTNAAVVITEDGQVYAQSRSRIITTADDNFGFARWVLDNASSLTIDLGSGLHFGEWWGSGIQRGYGLIKGEKRFSLFNTSRWAEPDFQTPGLGVVPVLHEGPFNTLDINGQLAVLAAMGSKASPGFMKPEGICVFHVAANHSFKVTIDKDEEPKGRVSS